MKNLTTEKFMGLVDDLGSICVLSNLAQYFEDNTEPYEDWEKEYFLIEAKRLLRAIDNIITQ
jgi:hypothetical protein